MKRTSPQSSRIMVFHHQCHRNLSLISLKNTAGKHTKRVLLIRLILADFDSRLQNCKDVWNTRECPYQCPGQMSFFDYFNQYHASNVCHAMLKDVRIAVGLGYPPDIFTTNASESLNAALKKKVNCKETEWPEFNQPMKQFVLAQREETICALSGRGQYRNSRIRPSADITTQLDQDDA